MKIFLANLFLLILIFLVSESKCQTYKTLDKEKNDSLMLSNAQSFLESELLSPTVSYSNNSPNVASIKNFSNTPINIVSGTTNISIPVYEIILPNLTVPISLDYFSGGVKVEEVSSDVGMSWMLNAGGAISRSVKGNFDFDDSQVFPSTPQNAFNPNNYFGNFADYDWLKQNMELCRDFEPDVFSYSFLGKSGKLMYDDDGYLRPYPFENIRFTYNQAWDASGNTYYFEDGEGALANSLCPGSISSNCIQDYSSNSAFLSKVVTVNFDTVRFEYELVQYDYASSINETVYKLSSLGLGCQIPSEYDYTICVINNSISASRIKAITTNRGHKVRFIYKNTERIDLPGTNALEEIIVEYENQEIKKVKLFSSYINGIPASKPGLIIPEYSHYRLILDSVQINQDEIYSFQYNSGLPGRLSFAQDYYGYFSGRSSTTLLPTITWPVTFNGSNRQVNPSVSAVGVMNRINYPTGGYSIFQYESNPVGGARIKKVSNFSDENILVTEKNYEYISDLSYGILNDFSFVQSKLQRQDHIDLGPLSIECNYSIITNNPSYIEVVWPRTIKYSKVDEFYSNGIESGKTSHYFSTGFEILNKPPNHILQSDESIYGGLPVKTEVYKNIGGANYSLVQVDSTVYELFANLTASSPPIINSPTQKIKRVLKATLKEPEIQPTWLTPFYPAKFEFVFYNYFSALLAPVKRISRIYSEESSNYFETLTESKYDNIHGNLTEEIKSNSDGLPQMRRIRYPYEFTGTVYSQMANKRILSKPLMEINYVDGLAYDGVMHSIKTQVVGEDVRFVLDGTYILEPNNPISYSFPTISPNQSLTNWRQLVTNTTFDNYGNITAYQENGVNKVIWYDFNGLLPILEGTNVTEFNVSYTSFENSDKGGWTYFGNPVSNTAMTGSMVYPLTSSNSITKNVRASVSFPFLLSFWAKSFTGTGTVTANGESTSIGGTWQFITRIITSRDLQTISGNNVMIDDLRLHPLASKIRTYTHRPFIGMSSISEFDGTVQRYQYDTKNRLWRVFDDKGNILSQFEYKYKSGPSF